MHMKKTKAAKLQYKVFKKLFSRDTRIHKRRVFLTEALEDLEKICEYSPQQLRDITHHIAVDISFNHFMGIRISNFRKYSAGYKGLSNQEIDRIDIILLPASLGFFQLFKRDEKYRVNYYHNGCLIHSTNQYARRF